MASITLGRVACPINCGHQAAQVKLKTDKAEGKAAHPYVHCAGCGVQVHARNTEQGNHIKAMMRPVEPVAAPVAPAETPKPSKTAQEAPKPVLATKPSIAPQKPPVAPPVAPGGLFGGIFG